MTEEDEAYDSSGPSLYLDSDERDSALGDNESMITMSVTDSVYNYRFENGRRYHAYSEGKYPVPNDEVEKDRLDLQHHAFRLTLDGALYRAPISENVQNVLDVGTGTGIWAIEFAEEHPSAKVLGTDLSPIQPQEVPPNCSFLIDDADNDWVFHESFDFIHIRAMIAAFKDWPRVFQQSYANLKPGGYIEIQDFYFPAMCTDPDITPAESPLLKWSELFQDAASKAGLDSTSTAHLTSPLRAAGFVNIHAKHYKWPVGSWAKGDKMKLLGRFTMEDLMDWLPASALALFTRVLKWSREEVEVFLASVRKELKEEKDRHFYANVVFWYAQKPLESTTQTSEEEITRDEEFLSEDDDATTQPTPPPLQTPEPSPGPSDAVSPGLLAKSTADLSLRSPKPSVPDSGSSNVVEGGEEKAKVADAKEEGRERQGKEVQYQGATEAERKVASGEDVKLKDALKASVVRVAEGFEAENGETSERVEEKGKEDEMTRGEDVERGEVGEKDGE